MKKNSKKKYQVRAIIALAALTMASPALGEEAPENLGTMVVTAPPMSDPFTVETDPKAPRQPVPASDGATMLKNIPGFSVTRKGGTDGDPSFRGLAGSRLNIIHNGDYILGGCGNRMDPPTAYIYPETFDTTKVIKGPQTVLYGGGNLGGTVLFERNTQRFTEPGARFHASVMAGSFERNDQVVDSTIGGSGGFARLIATHSQMDDYKDGSDRKVHSEYERWNASGILGFTPSDNTRLEFNLDRSDGEAAYADRTMDGVKFDRTGYGVRLEKKKLTSLIERLEVRAFHNYVDHVMDNFSMRQNSGMKMISNPDRTTGGGRAEAQLNLSGNTFLVTGVDYQANDHSVRTASGMMNPSVEGTGREKDAEFNSMGIFGELNHQLDEKNRLITGLRLDQSEAEASKISAAYGTAPAGTTDRDSNLGAFVRYEHDLDSAPIPLYTGLGRAERSPDYWERSKLFYLNDEASTQLDLGLGYRTPALNATFSLFYAKVNDYILIRNVAPTAQNVDATLYGGEADLSYALAADWRINASLAYTRGENDSFDTALPQVAPLEGNIGLVYDDRVWSAGVNVRMVSKQNRVDPGYGNIVGQDIGETAGFASVSLNSGYRAAKGINLTVGVDNLLDADYAEHISRTGNVAISGFEQTTRVNEPGRLLWLKASLDF